MNSKRLIPINDKWSQTGIQIRQEINFAFRSKRSQNRSKKTHHLGGGVGVFDGPGYCGPVVR